jgi:hypothetical protein
MQFTRNKNSQLRSALTGAKNRTAAPPRPQRKRNLQAAIAFSAAMLLFPMAAHAQGCTQCQDNTAATPPQTQAAYRHAIILMTLTAGGLFVGSIALFKRHR